jgi:signal transduction histidine kinase
MGKALHRIARELRPASIDDVGLTNTLSDYVAEWSAQFGVAAEFYCDHKKLDDLSDEVSTSIYRLVQEALTNISKHALGATAISACGTRYRLSNFCGWDIIPISNYHDKAAYAP